MKAIRVAVVDDSALCREVLRDILEEEGDIEVVAEANSGQAAVEVVEKSHAELVTLDIEMPGMDGLLAVEQIMAHTPVPILIVTGRPAPQRDRTLFEAVQRGALDLIAKPHTGDAAQAKTLRGLVRTLARVPVMRHIAGGRVKTLSSIPPSAAREQPGLVGPRDIPIIGVAASAGGPAAVCHVVSRLPRDFEGCVAVVQHLLPDFAASFVDFLRAHARLRVELAVGEMWPSRATVIVAPDNRHLMLSLAKTFVLSEARAQGSYRPSADVLFSSLAEMCGSNAIGVVLSGIGDDGAAGLLAMRKAGAMTIAQDGASCAVFGMPLAAQTNGGAGQVLALDEMSAAIARRARQLALRAATLPGR